MATSAKQFDALPDEVKELVGPHLAEDQQTLDAISIALREKRDEAVTARKSSGIEETWRMCEEAYAGIDDANRHEFANHRWSKPPSPDGPVTTTRSQTPGDPEIKSTAYVMLTARYVDAAAAKLAEILLPVDDKNFSITEMPKPHLIKAKADLTHAHFDDGTPMWRPARKDETVAPTPTGPAASAGAVPPAPAPATPVAAPAAGGAVLAGAGAVAPQAAPAAPPQAPSGHVPVTVKDLAEERIEMERAKAKRAEDQIYDWQVASQYPAEIRKVIADQSRCGVGVLKAPFAEPTKAIVVLTDEDGNTEVQIEKSIIPGSKWIDFWNIYPDPSCGENIHRGEYIWEHDWLSERQVRDLKKTPGYITKQLDRVIAEGPLKVSNSDKRTEGSDQIQEHKNRYEVWYYYGVLSREEVGQIWTAAGKKMTNADIAEEKMQVYVIVTMIGAHVVRCTINPLDSGKFPYHAVPWMRRPGHWAGKGVAEQIRMPQQSVNAATRAMFNNAGISGGIQIIIDQGAIEPADGNWAITPNKIWYKMAGEGSDDVRQSFAAITIPNVTEQMMEIVKYGMQLGEESTSIPLVTQGQARETTPDTFGATNLQDSNANQLLRAIGYTWDDCLTDPVTNQYYEWYLLDPNVPSEDKAMFKINAHGSAALVERAIHDQFIAQVGPFVKDPAYGGNPKRWFKMLLKSKRIDPVEVCNTEEEQAKIDAQPPVQLPQVQVATINQDTQMKILAAKQPAEQQTAENEQRIAEAAQVLEGKKVDAEDNRTVVEHGTKRYVADRDYDKALLQYATQRHITLDQARTDLAKTAMTLKTQRDLNAQDNAVDLHKHHNPPREDRQVRPQRPHVGAKPPGQLPGRAGNGRGFEQGPPR